MKVEKKELERWIEVVKIKEEKKWKRKKYK